MFVKCRNCGKKFEKRQTEINRSSNHYCSRSCAATMNNKGRNKKTKQCKICGEFILSNRQKCPDCIKNAKPPDYTLKDAIYEKHHKSSAFALVRSRARTIAKNANLHTCSRCGYDKHVEIAHIKPISSFSLDSKLSEINHLDNLLPLCPNCHWEFDHE
jgi:5-methylcytosine-specific restriction endonuclease McrA